MSIAEEENDEVDDEGGGDDGSAGGSDDAGDGGAGDGSGEGDADHSEDGAAWRGTIEDPKHQRLAGRYDSPAGVVAALAETQSQLQQRVKVPGSESTDAEITAYHKAVGVPAAESDYGLTKSRPAHLSEEVFNSEEVQAGLSKYQSVAKEFNISKAGLEAMAAVTYEAEANKEKAQAKADQDDIDAGEATLRTRWGKDYDRNVQIGDAMLNRFESTELGQIELKGGKLLGSHPSFISFIGMAGRLHGEGDLHMGLVGSDKGADLQKEVDDLTAEIHLAHGKGQSDVAERKSAERRKLISQLHGIPEDENEAA
jgi:hypothetical protein